MMKNIFFSTLIVLLVSCTEDVENVTLSGYVYSENTNKPLGDVIVEIENWYYGNSPDQSYNGYDKFLLITDSTGFYSVEFKKSAYITILSHKEGYSKIFKDKDTFWQNTKIDFHLLEVIY